MCEPLLSRTRLLSSIRLLSSMAGVKALILLAFAASMGITLMVLACALPVFNNWWPMFGLIFYALSPIPTLISRRFANSLENTSSALIEMNIFITSCIVVSAFALPVVLARSPLNAPVIQWGACGLIMSANVVVFLTIMGYFLTFGNEDFDYSLW